jgi:hypothetical protein
MSGWSRDATFADTVAAAMVAAESVRGGPAEGVRHTRNTVLGVGQVALHIEELRILKPVVAQLVGSCASALAAATPLHPVLCHAWVTCAQHVLQAFVDEARPSLPLLIPSAVRLLAEYGSGTASELPVVARVVEFMRVALASDVVAVRVHAPALFDALMACYDRLMGTLVKDAATASPDLHALPASLAETTATAMVHLFGHLIPACVPLPTRYASHACLCPSAPTMNDDETEDGLGNEDDVDDADDRPALPADGLLHPSPSAMDRTLAILLRVATADVTSPMARPVPAAHAIKETSAAAFERASDICWQVLPYWTALRARLLRQPLSAPIQPQDATTPAVESLAWLRDVLQAYTHALTHAPIATKADAKARAATLAGLAHTLRYLPSALLSDHVDALYDMVADLLHAAKDSPVKHAFAHVRGACIKVLVALMYALDGAFADLAEDFVFELAPLIKDPLILSDCIYACRHDVDLLQSVLLPKIVGDLLKALQAGRAPASVQLNLIESLGRIACYVPPAARVHLVVDRHISNLVSACVALVPRHADEVGMAALVALSRLMHLHCQATSSQVASAPAVPALLTAGECSAISQLFLVVLAETAFGSTHVRLDEGASASNKAKASEADTDAIEAEDLLSQLQLCALEMLKVLCAPGPARAVFIGIPVAAVSSSVPTTVGAALVLVLEQQQATEVVFEDELLVRESALELLRVLNE